MIVRNSRHTPLRLVSTLVALLAVVGLLAACSNTDGPAVNDAPLPDAKTIIDASAQTTRDLHDVQLDLSVEGTVPNLPVKSVSAYLSNQPKLGGQGNADVVYQGSAVKANFIVTDGDLYVQFSPGQAYNRTGKAADVYDASAILDPQRGIANLLSSVRDPKVDGREQIGGVEAVRISGIIPGAALAGIVPKSTLGDRPLTFWVQEAAPNNLVRANVGFDSGTLTVTLSDWGKKVTLLDPKTAK
ncbi:LppX_LprAFG lipoprotein [Tsukamurella asaccharolytica]|uniref:LppX_LprAFG lipoprotein n=1 Tax=Tsukamurella asaccharolytica TaxID=2592067 RepID=A0A5C5R5M2_9ACTN|nr:LppX_LprAFG lipoprotein [Tsukamurella asaccharolytica]TWS17623.1 LppX_LprAFG lipoprotein [Tsukamurella asaccharolytica]